MWTDQTDKMPIVIAASWNKKKTHYIIMQVD